MMIVGSQKFEKIQNIFIHSNCCDGVDICSCVFKSVAFCRIGSKMTIFENSKFKKTQNIMLSILHKLAQSPRRKPGWRFTADHKFRKLFYTSLVAAKCVASKVNVRFTRTGDFRTHCSWNVDIQKIRVRSSAIPQSAVNRQPRLPPRGLVKLFSSPCHDLKS